MSKHTPGPWAIDWNVSRLDVFSGDAATLVASIRRSAISAGIDETARANARLIAAAPDLLDVAETIELGIKRGYTPAELLDENSPIRDRIRAAIAKATGEAA